MNLQDKIIFGLSVLLMVVVFIASSNIDNLKDKNINLNKSLSFCLSDLDWYYNYSTIDNICFPQNLSNKIISCYVGNKSSCYNQKINGTDIVLWSGE